MVRWRGKYPHPLVADCEGDQHGRPSEFLPKVHRKYDAQFYFTATDKMTERATVMQEAPRGVASMTAYSEFLAGLSLINQQEYLNPEHTGRKAEAFNDNLLGSMPKGTRKLTLHNFARWERAIRCRFQAQSNAAFAKNLERRAKMSIDTPLKNCRAGHIPIRSETRDILLRPIEADFTWTAAFLQLYTSLTYVYALVVQIMLIAGVCSAAFICPRAGTCGLPAVAPPVQMRVASTVRMTSTKSITRPWHPYPQETCSFGKDGCEEPGYFVQWPYMQKQSGEVRIASAVTNECTRKSENAEYWVWDPFLQTLREEYYTCDKEVIAFEEKWSNTTDATESPYKVAFHVDMKYYQKMHFTTMTCMKQVISSAAGQKAGLEDLESFKTISGKSALTVRELMVECMAMRREEYEVESKCSCGLFEWENHPLPVFYSGPEETKTCVGGSRHGALCSDYVEHAENQCPEGQCMLKYPDQRPLNTSTMYGCFFLAPDAQTQMSPEFATCGESWWAYFSGMNHDDTPGGLQKASMIDFSKRSILLFIFLFKEGSFVTAFFAALVIATLALVLGLVLGSIIVPIAYYGWLQNNKHAQIQFGGTVLQVYSVVSFQITVLYYMLINMSSTYRMVKLVKDVFLDGLVNPSIQDMDKKLTNLANTVFNLVLLVTLNEYTSCTTSNNTQLLISLGLSLLLLLYQMNLEKAQLENIRKPLEDLNENRLTKFEFALLVTKIMEDFLASDVQYNFVQHFRSADSLLPLVDQQDMKDNEEAASLADESSNSCDPDAFFQTALMNAIVQDDPNGTVFYMPPLPVDLARRFGHDGIGEYSGAYSKTVTHEDGTIKLIPTIEEMLKLPPNSIPPNRHREMTPEGYQPQVVWDKKIFYGASPIWNGVGSAKEASEMFASIALGTTVPPKELNSGVDPNSVAVNVAPQEYQQYVAPAPQPAPTYVVQEQPQQMQFLHTLQQPQQQQQQQQYPPQYSAQFVVPSGPPGGVAPGRTDQSPGWLAEL